jgi:hypothetical protein
MSQITGKFMRKEKTITLESGGYVTIREITPANWNNISNEMGDDIENMSVAKAIALGPDKLATLAGDMVEFDGEFGSLGYTSLLEIWMAWRGVSESFLALLGMTKESKEQSHQKEPAVGKAESKPKAGKKANPLNPPEKS